MNIGFITDTNILKKNDRELNKDKSFLNNVDFFIEYIESLEKTSSDKKLVYFMPDIVIEELYYQKLNIFKTRYEALSENYKDIEYGLNGELPTCNIEDILNEEKEKYKNKDEITILELPYTKSIFRELMKDALEKNPPFDKTTEGYKTDAGYKDALIWKTIIYNKAIDECETIYFFSGDKIFKENEEYLAKEFKKHHNNTKIKIIYFKPDGSQRKNSLQYIIEENNLLETEIIKLYDLDLILNNIKCLKYNYDKDVYYYKKEQKNKLEDIVFEKFSNNDFEIESVTETSGKFEVLIFFSTDQYKIVNDKIIDTLNRKRLNGEIKFVFTREKNKFELDSYELINPEFNYSIIESLGNISNIITKAYNDSLKSTLEHVKLNIMESPVASSTIKSLNSIKPLIENDLLSSNISRYGLNIAESPAMSSIVESFNNVKPLVGNDLLSSNISRYGLNIAESPAMSSAVDSFNNIKPFIENDLLSKKIKNYSPDWIGQLDKMSSQLINYTSLSDRIGEYQLKPIQTFQSQFEIKKTIDDKIINDKREKDDKTVLNETNSEGDNEGKNDSNKNK